MYRQEGMRMRMRRRIEIEMKMQSKGIEKHPELHREYPIKIKKIKEKESVHKRKLS